MRVLALCLLALPRRASPYPNGYVACAAGADDTVPAHGAGSAAPGGTALFLAASADSATPLSSYVPGVTYAVRVVAPAGIRGFQVRATINSIAVLDATATKPACTGAAFAGLTHTSAVSKTSVAGSWTAPAAGAGAVTLKATLVASSRSNHYLTATVAEGVAATPSGTPSTTASPSRTPSPGSTPSGTPSPGSSPSRSPPPPPPPRALAFSAPLPGTPLTLAWTLNATHLEARLSSPAPGAWASIALNAQAGAMAGGDAVIIEPASSSIAQYSLTANGASGVVPVAAATLRDAVFALTAGGAPLAAGARARAAAAADGWAASWARPLAAGAYPAAQAVPAAGASVVVVAWGGAADGALAHHGARTASASVDWATGAVAPLGLRAALLLAHGGLMLAAWGVLFPAGALIARFAKGWPPSAPSAPARWFVWHVRVQVAGWVALVAGTACTLAAVPAGAAHFASPHAALGAAVALFGLLQPLVAAARPAPGAGARRAAFEAWHKALGWAVLIVLAPAALLTGLRALGAAVPLRAAVYAALAAAGAAGVGLAARRAGAGGKPPVAAAAPHVAKFAPPRAAQGV